MSDGVRARIRVRGIVQGVFFRQTTAREADRIGVTGWVKNLPTGDVEAVVEGDKKKVDEMIAWCHHGPPSARVEDVTVISEPFIGEFTHFSIEY